jgi:FXSXX-COOH protein
MNMLEGNPTRMPSQVADTRGTSLGQLARETQAVSESLRNILTDADRRLPVAAFTSSI